MRPAFEYLPVETTLLSSQIRSRKGVINFIESVGKDIYLSEEAFVQKEAYLKVYC